MRICILFFLIVDVSIFVSSCATSANGCENPPINSIGKNDKSLQERKDRYSGTGAKKFSIPGVLSIGESSSVYYNFKFTDKDPKAAK
jgi:hypothetical protein